MSGGVNNMFVSNCTFIGSDIGLRFKTARGRGGMVENIYVNNVNMLDIPAEAILFDMYYMAKDPVVLEGEKREPPKVEIKPVDESTPQFRNFYFTNITCNGAAKGYFYKGHSGNACKKCVDRKCGITGKRRNRHSGSKRDNTE
jgi:DNA sulfur modification protein DndE